MKRKETDCAYCGARCGTAPSPKFPHHTSNLEYQFCSEGCKSGYQRFGVMIDGEAEAL